MIRDIHFPDNARGKILDEYLSRGWYRLGQSIFTTDYIPSAIISKSSDPEAEPEDADPAELIDYRVYWLRFRLDHFSFGKKQQKLMSRNKDLEVEINPFVNNKDISLLYKRYSENLDFQVADTLSGMLYDFIIPGGKAKEDIFETWTICLRKKGKLIAAGIFDKGQAATAGIVNIYDPAYAKLSLGKYLMLLKIKFALENGMSFYYPGYISPDYSKFDYKLFPGPNYAEILNPGTATWEPYSEWNY